jgi:hypothetical protein
VTLHHAEMAKASVVRSRAARGGIDQSACSSAIRFCTALTYPSTSAGV